MIGLPDDPAVVTVLALRQFKAVATDVFEELGAAYRTFAANVTATIEKAKTKT